jgi:lipoprotein-anchoring transpeptidase ErfK/SrfK
MTFGESLRRWREVSAGRRGVSLVAVGMVVVMLPLAGSTGRGPGGVAEAGSDSEGQSEEKAAAAVTITPDDGTRKARPDKPILVSAKNGKLNTVSVKDHGKQVAGTFNADRTEWRTTWTLKPGTSYVVKAGANNSDGKPAQASSKFKTLEPDETLSASLDWILLGNEGKKYGVGLPIILNFDQPVRNKDRVEKALEVKAEKPVAGAWRWMGDQQVIYRTKKYWPAHQDVKLIAHLAGVRAAKGVYGSKNFTRTFEIGASRISTIDLKKHKMTVRIDGKKKRTYGVSGGNGSTREYTTTSGTHLTMEKGNPTLMVSPGRQKGDPGYYKEWIYYAVRFSNSGEYVHQTPGGEYCLGHANCSHGCVRQPASQAKWFFRTVQPADVVIVKGTDREVEWNNGWSFWQMPWKTWKKGSAAKLTIDPTSRTSPTVPSVNKPAATPSPPAGLTPSKPTPSSSP